MKYTQTYSFAEFNSQNVLSTVVFAVSDVYSELFSGNGIETDVFLLESVKKDLNLDDGSFAVDEMSFSINQFACETEIDLEAMHFCLVASNINKFRYCAVFFDAPSVENLLFVGKISNQISGDDQAWDGQEWGVPNIISRVYKFKALSFDASILERVSFNSKISKQDGTPVANLYEKFESENWASIKTITASRLTYVSPSGEHNFTHLMSLYDVLNIYCAKASLIIEELLGEPFSITLENSDLGISVCPTKYTFKDNRISSGLAEYTAFQNRQVKLVLSQDNTDTQCSPFISRKMIDAFLGIAAVDRDETKRMRQEAADNQQFSFRSYNNFLELLYAIARSFGVYLSLSYNSENLGIKIQFKSRSSIASENYIYLFGSEEAGFDTSSQLSDTPTQYFAQANVYSTDSIDTSSNRYQSENYEESEKLKQANKLRKTNEDRKGYKYERLLLSTSVTESGLRPTTGTANSYTAYPFNLSVTHLNTLGWDLYAIQNKSGGQQGINNYNRLVFENLHTGIYIRTTGIEDEQIALLAGQKIWRPAWKVFAKVGDENKDYQSLTDYVNDISANDLQFYKTEYNITVPFWNAFSSTDTGDDVNWNNCKLGSKIKLKESVKVWSNENWADEIIEREFVIVGIETSLDTPKTSLKLHSISRFAFGDYNADPSGLPPSGIQIATEFVILDSNNSKTYIAEPEAQIMVGDAVMLAGSGKITKARNQSSNFGKIIGIALSNSEDSLVTVQIKGRVELQDYNFTNSNGQVFCRLNDEGSNISQSLLREPNEVENMICHLGRADSSNSFILEIRNFKLT